MILYTTLQYPTKHTSTTLDNTLQTTLQHYTQLHNTLQQIQNYTHTLYTTLYNTQLLHNSIQLIQNMTNICTTLQNCMNLYMFKTVKIHKIVQHFTTTTHNLFKLSQTCTQSLHNCATLCTTMTTLQYLQNLTQLYINL